jgi:hypothetical protein
MFIISNLTACEASTLKYILEIGYYREILEYSNKICNIEFARELMFAICNPIPAGDALQIK